jgi:CheY-like chemotaxis protein
LSPRKSKILVVEDHFHVRQIRVLRLKELGYELLEADTRIEAFRQARSASPDLILMDLGMPILVIKLVKKWTW